MQWSWEKNLSRELFQTATKSAGTLRLATSEVRFPQPEKLRGVRLIQIQAVPAIRDGWRGKAARAPRVA